MDTAVLALIGRRTFGSWPLFPDITKQRLPQLSLCWKAGHHGPQPLHVMQSSTQIAMPSVTSAAAWDEPVLLVLARGGQRKSY
jgi:hypothetical protein